MGRSATALPPFTARIKEVTLEGKKPVFETDGTAKTWGSARARETAVRRPQKSLREPEATMKITTKKLLATLALSVMAFWATPGMADLIYNGSFELGTNPGSYTTVYAGGTNITGWTVTSGSVDYIGTYWDASDQDRSLDMNGAYQAGAIASTSFATTTGAWYEIAFDMAGNPDVQGVKNLRVSAANSYKDYTFNTTGKTKTNMGWVTETFTFKAIGTSTTLQFASLNPTPDAWGPALDNVRGYMVPLPGALILLGAGLVRLVAYSRRKRTLA
jgi:choice-of-anchor C domain-containing protein